MKHTYGANKAPEYVRLLLKKPGSDQEEVVPMSPATDGDYVTGKVYTKSLALTSQGQYLFRFEAKEGADVIRTETPSEVIVGEPTKPELVDPQVRETGTGGGRFTYTVKYKQAQNLPPAWVRLEIALKEKPETARVIDMVRENGHSVRRRRRAL